MQSRSANTALTIVIAHVFLVAAFGQFYAKLDVTSAAPIYPTELAILGAALIARREVLSVPWDTMTKLVVAFVGFGIVWVALGGGLGSSEGVGPKAFSFFIYSLLYFVVRGCATTNEARWRLLTALAKAAVVGMLFGFWRYRLGEAALDPTRISFETSTGAVRWLPGEFALYAMFGALVVLVGAIITRRLPAAGWALLLAALVELAFAQHRSGFVAFAFAVLSTTVLLGGSTQALRGLLKLGALLLVAVAAYMWLFGGSYVDETITRIQHTTDMDDPNVAWRLLAWYEVGNGILEKPFGHGFATWDFLFTLNAPTTGSHNSYLDLGYRIGVPGLLVFLAMPYTLVARTRQLVQRHGPKAQVLPITVSACMLAFLVYASFNVVLDTPYMSIFFWLLLGLGAGAA